MAAAGGMPSGSGPSMGPTSLPEGSSGHGAPSGTWGTGAASRPRSMLSKTSRASWATPYRLVGSTAVQRLMKLVRATGTGSPLLVMVTWGRGPRQWARAISASSIFGTGGWPVSISARMQPKAYTSVAGVVGRARHCSGAMYFGVPSTPPSLVSWVWLPAPCSEAMPKSNSRACHSRPLLSSMSTLEGLRSRCTTPIWWAAARPRRMATPTLREASRPSPLERLITRRSVGPSISSIAM